MKTQVSLGMKKPFSDVSFVVLKNNKVLIHCIMTGFHVYFYDCKSLVLCPSFWSSVILSRSFNTYILLLSYYKMNESHQCGIVKGRYEEWRKSSRM